MSDLGDQRRYYERMMDEIATEHRQQIDQLEAENAKLRELVRDIADHVNLDCSCHLLYGLKVDGFVACAGCPVYDKGADVDDCCYDTLLEWLKGASDGE